ncbi:MAG: HprK-related kinase B [Desulfohalobiaceae bacterium]
MQDNTYLDLIFGIRRSFPASWCLTLQFCDFKLDVRTNSPDVQAGLQDYFQSFLTLGAENPDCRITVHQAPVQEFPFQFQVNPPDPGKSKIKEESCELGQGRIVKKRLTGMHFIFGPREHLAVGPCLQNLNQVVNFINNRYIEHMLNQGALLGHAAGVQLSGQGLAIAGNSGSGKSSLALRLLSQGFSYTSNDRLLVKENCSGLSMYGVAKMPRINPGTALHNPVLQSLLSPEERQTLLKMSPEELWRLEQKYDVPIEKFYGQDRFILQGPLDILLVLNWEHSQKPLQIQEFSPADRPELIRMFQKGTGLFYCPDPGRKLRHCLEDYCRILEKARMFEICGGIDFEQAAQHCLQITETSNGEKRCRS